MLSNAFRLTCLLGFALSGSDAARAAGPDVCVALPVATVNELVHQSLTGTRSDVSEEAHSYGCAYGAAGRVSVSVIRPGGAAAFSRTSSRYPNAMTVAGLGDKAMHDKQAGTIAIFGDMAIDAFVPQGSMSDAEILAMEKALILAARSKL